MYKRFSLNLLKSPPQPRVMQRLRPTLQSTSTAALPEPLTSAGRSIFHKNDNDINLSDTSRTALARYTASSHAASRINDFLRAESPSDMSKETESEIKETIENLVGALEELGEGDKTQFMRLIEKDPQLIKELDAAAENEQNRWCDKGFMSTTGLDVDMRNLKPEESTPIPGWANIYGVGAGSNVKLHSAHSDEAECLFPPDTPFFVRKGPPDYYFLYQAEIPEGPLGEKIRASIDSAEDWRQKLIKEHQLKLGLPEDSYQLETGATRGSISNQNLQVGNTSVSR